MVPTVYINQYSQPRNSIRHEIKQDEELIDIMQQSAINSTSMMKPREVSYVKLNSMSTSDKNFCSLWERVESSPANSECFFLQG